MASVNRCRDAPAQCDGQAADRCGLCREIRPLQQSHAIPKALYRICRAEGERNPHPVIVTPGHQGQASHQIKDYFLCRGCEERFDRQGENWVMRNCYRGRGKFLMRDMFSGKKPLLEAEGASVFAGSLTDGIDVEALTYFPMSVFWRCGARSWNLRGFRKDPIELGIRYQEEIRLFLLGDAQFPEYASLTVWVSSREVPLLAAHFPMSERAETVYVHRLYIPGIQFMLALGRQIEASHLRGCIKHGRDNPVWMSDQVDSLVARRFREILSRTNGLS